MRIILGLLFLLFSKFSLVSSDYYKVLEKSDKGKNYTFFTINNGKKEVAKACMMDPSREYYFFSKESDPFFFYRNIEKNYFTLSMDKLKRPPMYAILADFSVPAPSQEMSWNLKYLFSYVGVILLAPPYLRGQEIINSAKTSRRFFLEITINKKDYYGLIVFNNPTSEEVAREMLKNTKVFGDNYRLVAVLDYFPIKFVAFHGKEMEVIYESHKGHAKYDCLFITGKTERDF